jgi:RNA-binding protein
MAMLEPLTNAQIRKFKAAAQLLEPMLKVGKAGLSEGFVRSVSEALDKHELVKIKFAEFKDQKKELAPLLASQTQSHLVMRVGNVMVLHRPKAEPAPPPADASAPVPSGL